MKKITTPETHDPEIFTPFLSAMSHQFEVIADPVEVLRLLTPEGERKWVPGWDPEYLGNPEPVRAGLVFRTTADGHDTLWSVADYDEHGLCASYHRFTPGLKVGIVEVSCKTIPDGSCRVVVSYQMTGLSADGNEELREMERGFRAYVEGWKVALEKHLSAAPTG